METTQEAQRRAKIITFWKKHGLEATKDAFGVSRSTLFEWQRRLHAGKGRLSALEPRSRRPKNCRSMATSSYVIERICAMRRAFPHYGQEKIKILLTEERIVVSAKTIWKVIRRFDLPSAPRQYVARRKRKKKPRKADDFAATKPGELVSMDTIVIQENGKKKYIITALDHATRIALARTYARHSSKQARDLLHRIQLALGVPIAHVLTDNGSEFMAVYEQACKDLKITHFWTYPRSPKMNAHSERFNRTIQEEARFPSFEASIQQWNAWIGHYIMEYNCYRPHYALDYRRPIDEYMSRLSIPAEQSSMWVTHTTSRKRKEYLL